MDKHGKVAVSATKAHALRLVPFRMIYIVKRSTRLWHLPADERPKLLGAVASLEEKIVPIIVGRRAVTRRGKP